MRILDFSDGFESSTEPTVVGYAASNVSVTPSGNLASDNAQDALEELQGDVDTLNTGLSNHLADDTDAHDASAISNAPNGNLEATTVQTALDELQTDIDTRALDADLDSHIGNTSNPHVVTATQVGKDTAQWNASKLQDFDVHNATPTDGKILGYVGANSRWEPVSASASSGILPFRSVTTTDSPTTADEFLLCSGSSFTINLFTAVGNTGKVVRIFHGGTNNSEVYTIDPDGTETFGGQSTYSLYHNGESVTAVSDGTNWIILEHFTNIYFGAVATTGTWIANTTYEARYWRRGDKLIGSVKISLSGAPTSANMEINLPFGTMDMGKLYYNQINLSLVGNASLRDASGTTFIAQALAVDGSNDFVRLRYLDDGAAGVSQGGTVTQAVPVTWASGDNFVIDYELPMTGWQP